MLLCCALTYVMARHNMKHPKENGAMESPKIKKDILMWGIFLVLGVLMITVIIPG